jgi:hypothetical protein
MNPALLGLAIIASQFLLALALLFVVGSLIRIDLNRAEAADSRFAKIPSRFVRDLRALKDALVEFFARSNETCRILSVLVAQRKPLRLSAIVQEIQFETDRSREPYALPMSIAWAILWILQVSGLVRMSLHGFVITDVGREVYRRIEANSLKTKLLTMGRELSETSAPLTEDYQSAMPGLFCRTHNFDPVVRASAALRLPRRTLRSERGVSQCSCMINSIEA